MLPESLLVLDRKGEYIENTVDQQGNIVYGLQNHPMAHKRMVIVSQRQDFLKRLSSDKIIHAGENLCFNIQDVEPSDLADFLRNLTPQQADIIRDYAHINDFYEKVLAETHLGFIDKRDWFRNFPGLIAYDKTGKELIKKYERDAKAEGRIELNDEERDELNEKGGTGGNKVGVLENAIRTIQRFCHAPFFGGGTSGSTILRAPSCVDKVLQYLKEGKSVFIDLRGLHDDQYTMIAALFARRLLNNNKNSSDRQQIRACIVMEEAQNILREEELYKGDGKGSVFIELAREGRSYKLGFLLVTQQPDARSIAPEVAKTIDTVVAFNMPPDDAKNLPKLKSAFAGLELQVANADIFEGVAVGNGRATFFKAQPIDPKYMQACVDRTLLSEMDITGTDDAVLANPPIKSYSQDTNNVETELDSEPSSIEQSMPVSERLVRLSKQRQETIQKVSVGILNAWRHDNQVTRGEGDE